MDEIKEVVHGSSALGFLPSGMEKGFGFQAPVPDYALSGFPEVVAYLASALLGAALLIVAFKLLGLLKKGRDQASSRDGA